METFLKSKGFNSTTEPPKPKKEKQMPDPSLLTDTVQYEQSYISLKSWIDNSIDKYRLELKQILYPLFIHIYLLLIETGGESKHFFEQFKQEHLDLHKSDLSRLDSILNASQIKENEYIQTLLYFFSFV